MVMIVLPINLGVLRLRILVVMVLDLMISNLTAVGPCEVALRHLMADKLPMPQHPLTIGNNVKNQHNCHQRRSSAFRGLHFISFLLLPILVR